MLTEDQRTENKNKFISLLTTNVKRSGVNELLTFLENSDFYDAPASTRYHSAFQGGLCYHTLNVYERLLSLVKAEYGNLEASPYSLETITVIALLHDFSKTNFYTVDTRNVKNDKGVWEKVPYYAVRQPAFRVTYGTHSQTSIYLIYKFINLTEDEEIAILHHMGGKDSSDGSSDSGVITSEAFNKYPIATLTHLADLAATFLDERLIYET